MKTLPDFLSDEPSSASEITAPAPETPQVDAAPAAETPTEAAPAAAGQPRGADGKFAPIAAPASEAAPAAAAPAEPPPAAPEAPAPVLAPAPTPEPNFAPISALLDERDKRQAAEKRARELEQWREQQEAQARRQPTPDPAEDPAGFQAFQEQQRQGELWGMRLEMSRGFAAMRHGPEVAEQAFQWGVGRCDQDPFFNAKVRASADPVGYVVAEWQREQQLATMTPERLAAFQAWEAAQTAQPAPVAAAIPPAPLAAPAAPPAPQAPPRPSLAGAPSAAPTSAPIPRDGEATFAKMFGQ